MDKYYTSEDFPRVEVSCPEEADIFKEYFRQAVAQNRRSCPVDADVIVHIRDGKVRSSAFIGYGCFWEHPPDTEMYCLGRAEDLFRWFPDIYSMDD